MDENEDSSENEPLDSESAQEDVEEALMIGYVGILKLRHPLVLEEVDIHRDDECEMYLDCLDKAAERHWSSFSCMFCLGDPCWEEIDETDDDEV